MSPSLCLEGLSSSSTNSCEAQECQDAYSATVSHQKKLLSLRIMEYQFSKRLSSSSGDKVWNHLEILEILLWWKWLDLLLHWVYKATFWSLWWTARTTSLSSSHVPAPHSSSQFQWTQGTAEPCSQSGGISWKTYLRNYKKCCTTVEREEWEICEKAVKVPRSEKEGTRCSRHWKRDSPTAHAGAGLSWRNWAHVQPMLKQFVKDCIPLEGPSQEYWKSVIRKKWQRGAVTGWSQQPFPVSWHHSGRGVRIEGLMLSLRKRRRVKGRQYKYFVFVSHHPALF